LDCNNFIGTPYASFTELIAFINLIIHYLTLTHHTVHSMTLLYPSSPQRNAQLLATRNSDYDNFINIIIFINVSMPCKATPFSAILCHAKRYSTKPDHRPSLTCFEYYLFLLFLFVLTIL